MAKKTGKTTTRTTRKPVPKPAGRRAKPAARKPAKKTARRSTSTAASRRSAANPLFAPVRGAERRYLGRVQLEVARAGAARVKRMIYPPGFRWSVDMKPAIGTDLCMHAHVGFLVHGEIHIEYADGCVVEYRAPQVVAIDPGHDGWVVGNEPVVLIEFDFERETVQRMGMPNTHRHD